MGSKDLLLVYVYTIDNYISPPLLTDYTRVLTPIARLSSE